KVDDTIQDGDHIVISKGENGTGPNITIKQLVGEFESIPFYFNDNPALLTASVYVNGTLVNEQYIVQDNDKIVTNFPQTVQDFLNLQEMNDISNLTSFNVYVD